MASPSEARKSLHFRVRAGQAEKVSLFIFCPCLPSRTCQEETRWRSERESGGTAGVGKECFQAAECAQWSVVFSNFNDVGNCHWPSRVCKGRFVWCTRFLFLKRFAGNHTSPDLLAGHCKVSHYLCVTFSTKGGVRVLQFFFSFVHITLAKSIHFNSKLKCI